MGPRGKKILVVDDEADIVQLISMILSSDEIEVLGAYDGREALEIARRELPHLVLSDVMMPRMDGRDLCKAIRSAPELSDTRMVLMSALHRLDLQECHEDGFIPKPFGIDVLREMVDRLLSDSA